MRGAFSSANSGMRYSFPPPALLNFSIMRREPTGWWNSLPEKSYNSSTFVIFRKPQRPPYVHIVILWIQNSVKRQTCMYTNDVGCSMVGLQLAKESDVRI